MRVLSTQSSQVLAYADLAKAKLSALVVTTTLTGFVAAGGPIPLDTLAGCLTGTMLCSSSAAAWNQILEIPNDRKMKRTQQRPLVKDTLTVGQAQGAATVWGIGGVGLLYATTDPVTTMLGASNIVLYSGLYTYLKQHSVWNTWVGAVVGAIPPVMGWTAATGGSLLDIEAALLGATLYCWQMPHFFALSYMHRQDYQRGGFVMLPNVDVDRTANVILRYAYALSAVPFVATATGVTSSMFALEGIALNAIALRAAHGFHQDRTNANARKIFLTSLWYLPSLLMLFVLHSKVWDEEKDDVLAQWVADQVHAVRAKGRGLCIHEKAVAAEDSTEDKCPVSVARRESVRSVDVVSSVVQTELSSSATPEK